MVHVENCLGLINLTSFIFHFLIGLKDRIIYVANHI